MNAKLYMMCVLYALFGVGAGIAIGAALGAADTVFVVGMIATACAILALAPFCARHEQKHLSGEQELRAHRRHA